MNNIEEISKDKIQELINLREKCEQKMFEYLGIPKKYMEVNNDNQRII